MAIISLGLGQQWSVTDTSLQRGSIGLRTYLADVYYDDLKVRPLVSPEPLVTMGLTETVAAQNPTSYYYAGSKRIAMRTGGALYYMFSDHLGGTSVVLNAATGATSRISYLPFGGARSTSGSLQTDRLFTGQRCDSYIKLYEMGARWSGPVLTHG